MRKRIVDIVLFSVKGRYHTHHRSSLSTMVVTRKRTREALKVNDVLKNSSSYSTPKASTAVSPFTTINTPSTPISSNTSMKPVSDTESIVVRLLSEAGIQNNTKTKSGWCLREGLIHILNADGGKMIPIVQSHGLPSIYSLDKEDAKSHCRHENTNTSPETSEEASSSAATKEEAKEEATTDMKSPQNCFQSLCRIVAGQQLAGAAARNVWNRLMETTGDILTPEVILSLERQGMEDYLKKPAGLSTNKARSICALAHAFHDGTLTESFLVSSSESEVRERLLSIRGLGPWSCDMFLMFYLERANIFPVGDLGVRKGISKYFPLRGKGKGGSLCPKADLAVMQRTMEPYKPYQSLVTYYMWKAADSKYVYGGTSDETTATTTTTSSTKKKSTRTRKKSKQNVVTP